MLSWHSVQTKSLKNIRVWWGVKKKGQKMLSPWVAILRLCMMSSHFVRLNLLSRTSRVFATLYDEHPFFSPPVCVPADGNRTRGGGFFHLWTKPLDHCSTLEHDNKNNTYPHFLLWALSRMQFLGDVLNQKCARQNLSVNGGGFRNEEGKLIRNIRNLKISVPIRNGIRVVLQPASLRGFCGSVENGVLGV